MFSVFKAERFFLFTNPPLKSTAALTHTRVFTVLPVTMAMTHQSCPSRHDRQHVTTVKAVCRWNLSEILKRSKNSTKIRIKDSISHFWWMSLRFYTAGDSQSLTDGWSCHVLCLSESANTSTSLNCHWLTTKAAVGTTCASVFCPSTEKHVTGGAWPKPQPFN